MSKTNQYKVIVADDHLLLRDTLTTLINSFEELRVIAVAEDGESLVKMIRPGHIPDLILLDISMPKMDGFATAMWLHEHYPDIRVLVLTMYDSEIALIRLLQLGVKGFLKKDIHPTELRKALMAVAENGYYYSHNTTGKLASLIQKNYDNQSSLEKAMLTKLEIDFLQLASTEMTYKEIAAFMKITPRMIDSYRDTLFDKLNVKSRVGLAIYAVRNGIVSI